MGKELYRMEDDEGPIIVTQRGNRRLLNFGSKLEQSSVLMTKPYYLIHEYTQIMLLGLVFAETRSMTLLGLGGGGLVHCLSHYYPDAMLRVVEIRHAVIDIAYDWFELPRRDRLQVINDDAMHYVSQLISGSSDIIFSDLYQAEDMSACQAQQDFIAASHRALSDSGCLVLNFHERPETGSTLMKAMKKLFSVIIVHQPADSSAKRNAIMFCCKHRVALHQPGVNWRAECLKNHVNMPLLQYYRELCFI
jgi:spermidine synthase